MFSGTMVGAVSEDKNTESTLWNDSGIVNTRQSVISNITVNQTFSDRHKRTIRCRIFWKYHVKIYSKNRCCRPTSFC